MEEERLLGKDRVPSEEDIQKYIGKKTKNYLNRIKKNLEEGMNLKVELKYPFGDKYGWGYKFSQGTRHLFYLFFTRNGMVFTLQLKKIETELGKQKFEELSDEGKTYWENRYPCGDGGGWIHYRLLNESNYQDIGRYIMIKLNKEIEWN
jgi:hypothetical protein